MFSNGSGFFLISGRSLQAELEGAGRRVDEGGRGVR